MKNNRLLDIRRLCRSQFARAMKAAAAGDTLTRTTEAIMLQQNLALLERESNPKIKKRGK